MPHKVLSSLFKAILTKCIDWFLSSVSFKLLISQKCFWGLVWVQNYLWMHLHSHVCIQYTLHVNPNGKHCQQMCVFSRACFTAVCLSTLWSQTLDRSCEVSITSKSNGGPVLLHFTSWEVLIGSFLGKWAKNSFTKADKCNRRRKDYQSNGVKPAFAVTEAKACLICVPRHAIQLLIQFRNHTETLFSPHRDTHLPFRHNWISIKMYHYEYSWHYRVRIHRNPGRL